MFKEQTDYSFQMNNLTKLGFITNIAQAIFTIQICTLCKIWNKISDMWEVCFFRFPLREKHHINVTQSHISITNKTTLTYATWGGSACHL